jgi:non-homologous end joining protein Ku
VNQPVFLSCRGLSAQAQTKLLLNSVLVQICRYLPYFVTSYLLGCGSASAKAYRLLNAAMTNSRAALAKFVMRGKEHLGLIRPYGEVLMLHTMHYADEIRSAEEIDHRAKSSVGASELKLAERLVNDLSKDEFEPDLADLR